MGEDQSEPLVSEKLGDKEQDPLLMGLVLIEHLPIGSENPSNDAQSELYFWSSTVRTIPPRPEGDFLTSENLVC